MNTNENKILSVITLIVLIVVIIQASHNIIQANKLVIKNEIASKTQLTKGSTNEISGKIAYGDRAEAQMCINTPPILTYNCNMTNATLHKNVTYNCTFSAIDPNADHIDYSLEWLTWPPIFNITNNGTINFKPRMIAEENLNIFRLYLIDNSECNNSNRSLEFNFTVTGKNRPPYLVQNIPDQKIEKNQYFRFYLTDYFADPDEDELTYFYILETGNTIKIKIKENIVDIKGHDCGISTAYFVATDNFGATAQSNTITYNVTCSDSQDEEQNTNQDSNSGGGDGSGDDNEETEICKSNWRCNAWASCLKENFTYKRCIDYNGCKTPYQQFILQNCTYNPKYSTCNENWECSDWSVCKEGIHTRICMDLKNCETNNTKPQESEACNKISTCYNGMKDGDETGVDCGGSCGTCSSIENPSKINSISRTVLITLGLTIGFAMIALMIFKDNIKKFYNKLFRIKYKIKRRIYINNKQKDKLIQSINIIQERLNEHKINHAIDETNIFIKEYFKQLLAIEIFEKEELITKIVKLNNKELEKILVMFYAKIINIVHQRNNGITLNETEIQSLIDESANNIFLIGEFTEQDAISSIKDRKNTSQVPIERLYNKLSNLYIALKFKEIVIAKNNYKDVLKYYNILSEKEKVKTYNDITRAYESIMYLEKEYTK